MALLLPSPVPVNQLAEVGRLLTVFDNEFVFKKLLRCGTLQTKSTLQNTNFNEGINYDYMEYNMNKPLFYMWGKKTNSIKNASWVLLDSPAGGSNEQQQELKMN